MATSAAATAKTPREDKPPAYTREVTADEAAEIYTAFEEAGIDRFTLANLFVAGEQSLRRWANGTHLTPHPGMFRLAVWQLATMRGLTRQVKAIYRRYEAWDNALTKAAG